MPHHVYTTKGIVLSSRPVREADRLVRILTEEVGLVTASASGIRKGTSKLGGILLDFAFVRVSLVRGKHSWRMTTAGLERDIAREIRGKKKELLSVAKVAALIERLVKGEEKHAELFTSVYKDIFILLEGVSDTDAWEILAVSHILFELGYLSKTDIPKSLGDVMKERKPYIVNINNGIRESGLY